MLVHIGAVDVAGKGYLWGEEEGRCGRVAKWVLWEPSLEGGSSAGAAWLKGSHLLVCF